MLNILAIALGGAVGSVLRHLVGVLALRSFGPGFPIGTMAINVTGSFVMGVVAALFALRWSASESARLLVTTGFLGGYTTFSAFSLDVAVLWERGEVAPAIFYAAGSVIISILALFAGLALVRSLT
ncbi:MAG: fluoride efflux transporter CrcB [Bauldia sp.]|nr:fluoride efflux transporter CrcB [Bauldia sp.]